MTTYLWSVENYAVFPSLDDLTNVVSRVGWRVVAEREGASVTRMGVTELPAANATTFIVWDDVTDDLALDWVRAELSANSGLTDINGDPIDGVTAIETSLEAQLDALPPVTVTLPPRSAGGDE